LKKEYTIIELLELELHLEEEKYKHALTAGNFENVKLQQERINYLKNVIIAIENRDKTFIDLAE
jgi:hypothetical protein